MACSPRMRTSTGRPAIHAGHVSLPRLCGERSGIDEMGRAEADPRVDWGWAGPVLLCLLPILQEADACRGGPTEGVAAPSLLAVRARLFGAYFTRSAPCHA